MSSWTRLFTLSWAIVFFAGCAGYKLGPSTGVPAGARSVQVNPFQNQTLEPRLSEPVTMALRKQIQRDGTYKLETSGTADVLIMGILTDYKRAAISYQPGDIITVRDYRLTVTAKVTARERGTGKLLFEKNVSGQTLLRAAIDIPSAERQAISSIADDLARKAVSLLVDGDW